MITRIRSQASWKRSWWWSDTVTDHNYNCRYGYNIGSRRSDALLYLFRLTANEPILTGLLIVWNSIAIAGVILLSKRLDDYAPSVSVPDLRVRGYTSTQIYDEFYNTIGTEGCTIYYALATWDVFILIPAYTLLLGTLWVHVSRCTYDKMPFANQKCGYWNADRRAHIVMAIALMDCIETMLQRRGCALIMENSSDEQQQLSEMQIRLASTAVTLKWFLLLLFFLSIIERLYRGYAVGTKKATYLRLQLPL
jgi:hypothetical protein